VISAWLGRDGGVFVAERVAESRPAGPGTDAGSELPQLEGTLTRGDGVPADLGGAWPRFRGANSDNIRPAGVPLSRRWPKQGPPVLWSVDLGEGYAGPAVLNGRVYVLDYDRQGRQDALRCLSLADGREIWRFAYPVTVKRNHGMSRTVPAVTDKHVVTIGPKCHLTCVDAVSGRLRWAMNLVRQFGTEVPLWYAGQCPLIDDGRAIIAPAGPDVLMMAIDCDSGEIVWKTPNPLGWKMTHSSIIPMTLDGRRTYVYCASKGVVAVAADTGQALWRTDIWHISTTVPSALPLEGGRILFTGGYNAGSLFVSIDPSGTSAGEDGQEAGDALPFGVTEEFRLKPKLFASLQHTPVYYNGYIYAVRPDGQLVCLDPAGKITWTSGPRNTFFKGYGPWLIADGMIFVMDSDGELTLAEASPRGYTQLARARVLDGGDSWGPMAIAEGRLLVRDLTRMICLDVSETGNNAP